MDLNEFFKIINCDNVSKQGAKLYSEKNIRDAFEIIKPKKHLSDIERDNVRKDYKNKISYKDISEKYNISFPTIFNICKGLEKRHLTKNDALNIIASYKLGNITQKELAKIYDVGNTTISAIVTGQNFRELIAGENKKYKKTGLKVRRK